MPFISRVLKGPALLWSAYFGTHVAALLLLLGDEVMGYTVRLCLPYGRDWYAYSMRRLRENPAMINAISKGLFKRERIEKRAHVGQASGRK